jgi:ribonuclease P protein component
MLKKKERLTRAEFDAAFAAGKRVHSPLLQVIVAPSPSFHGAVVVGKKVYKKAVDRNKLRRQLYAIVYQFSKKDGVLAKTFITITKPAITKAAPALIRTELETALKVALKL